jgi:hypothetical protein
MLATSSTHATNAALYRRLAFNPVRDFTPISQIAFVPNLLVVNPEVPVSSIAELVAHAKARPGQLNYGSGGAGTSLHLAAAVFAYRAGIDMVHVPYRGGAPVAADLVSGKIQVSFSPLVEVLQQVRAGKLRALGVTTARRSALLPAIPTISEVIPGYEVALRNGIMGGGTAGSGGEAPCLGDRSHRRQPGNAVASWRAGLGPRGQHTPGIRRFRRRRAAEMGGAGAYLGRDHRLNAPPGAAVPNGCRAIPTVDCKTEPEHATWCLPQSMPNSLREAQSARGHWRRSSRHGSLASKHAGFSPHRHGGHVSELRTDRKTYRTRDEARADVFDYIERFYNSRRRHSTIGYKGPVEFEMMAVPT